MEQITNPELAHWLVNFPDPADHIDLMLSWQAASAAAAKIGAAFEASESADTEPF